MRGREVTLLQPTTWMNDSGRSVAAALRALKLPLDRMLVVHDHIDLPFGKLRLAAGGGAGGHNGMKSVIGLIGRRLPPAAHGRRPARQLRP